MQNSRLEGLPTIGGGRGGGGTAEPASYIVVVGGGGGGRGCTTVMGLSIIVYVYTGSRGHSIIDLSELLYTILHTR